MKWSGIDRAIPIAVVIAIYLHLEVAREMEITMEFGNPNREVENHLKQQLKEHGTNN